mmetsp:Transcript_16700/g.34430  ORF Transcript_16700/g.34430 Transcript_16700/m.34430 type:complete len:260 (+) Transcript_16700:438-1217(+)
MRLPVSRNVSLVFGGGRDRPRHVGFWVIIILVVVSVKIQSPVRRFFFQLGRIKEIRDFKIFLLHFLFPRARHGCSNVIQPIQSVPLARPLQDKVVKIEFFQFRLDFGHVRLVRIQLVRFGRLDFVQISRQDIIGDNVVVAKRIEGVVHSSNHPVGNVSHIYNLFHVRGNCHHIIQGHGVVFSASQEVVPKHAFGNKHDAIIVLLKDFRPNHVLPPELPQTLLGKDGNVPHVVVRWAADNLVQSQIVTGFGNLCRKIGAL